MRKTIPITASAVLIAAITAGCGPSVPQKSARGGVLSGTEVERQRYNVRQTPNLAGNGPQEVVGQSSAAPTTHTPVLPSSGTRAPGPVAPGAAATGTVGAGGTGVTGTVTAGGTTGTGATSTGGTTVSGSNAGGGAGTATTPPAGGTNTNTNPAGTPNDTNTGRSTGGTGTTGQ